MTIPAHSRRFFGKENLMASFNKWITETIEGGYEGIAPLPSDKEFFWAFDFPTLPEFTPAIGITEVGLFNPGATAFDGLLFVDPFGVTVTGTMNQTLIQIDCIDQNKDGYNGATKKVRNLRDRVVHALMNPNIVIPFVDYDNPLKPVIGWIMPDNSSNSINEKFLVDPSNLQLRRMTIVLRILWLEINQGGTGTDQDGFVKTITSDTEVV